MAESDTLKQEPTQPQSEGLRRAPSLGSEQPADEEPVGFLAIFARLISQMLASIAQVLQTGDQQQPNIPHLGNEPPAPLQAALDKHDDSPIVANDHHDSGLGKKEHTTGKVMTYVLAGYDGNAGFKHEIASFQKRADEKGDVVILRPQPGKTLAETVNQIQSPANILVMAHGSENGSFRWGKEESISYRELFSHLPENGIQSITIGGCYGESGVSMLEGAPKGTIVQAIVGAKVVGWGGEDKRFSKELVASKEITPLTIMLKALDNTDPLAFSKRSKEFNERAENQLSHNVFNTNPNDVLPHTIGIGGFPPVKLDLNEKLATLSSLGKAHKLDHEQFKKAISQVKKHFDPSNGEIEINGDKLNEWIDDKTGMSPRRIGLNSRVDAVAKKIESGADVQAFTLEEKRIGYALTVANLYETGEMTRLGAQLRGEEVTATRVEDPKPKREDLSSAMVRALQQYASGHLKGTTANIPMLTGATPSRRV
jgi:hypothetical protein